MEGVCGRKVGVGEWNLVGRWVDGMMVEQTTCDEHGIYNLELIFE